VIDDVRDHIQQVANATQTGDADRAATNAYLAPIAYWLRSALGDDGAARRARVFGGGFWCSVSR
jgi:hypothetical protein